MSGGETCAQWGADASPSASPPHRPYAFDTETYQDRNTVERTINKLKGFRAVAMRTDKREFVFRGTIDVASIKIWLRDPTKQDL